MSKEATPPQLFKKFRSELFVQYLRQNEALPELEPGDKLPKADTLFRHWAKLPEEKQNLILADLRDAHELASYEGGVQAVLSEARYHDEKERVAEAVRTMTDAHELMTWILVEIPLIIKNAFKFAYSDRLNLKSWDNLPGFLCDKPRDDKPVKQILGDALSQFFMEKESRGERHEVDILKRDEVIYYFVYLEDYPRKQPGFEERGFNHHRIRKEIFEIIFRYDPRGGILETYAKGVANKHRDKLIDLFSEHCLYNAQIPSRRGKKAFHIEQVLTNNFFFPPAPDMGIKGGRVKSLRFALKGAMKYVTVESHENDVKTDARDLWDQMRLDGEGEEYPHLQGSQLIRVELEIQFTPEDGEREPRTRPFSLTSKTSSLHYHIEDENIRRYLETLSLVKDGKV